MSIKIMSWVWENSRQEGGALLTLLAMADFADDAGICWPSTATLARKARLKQREIFYILAKLKMEGEITQLEVGKGHRSSRYLISTSAKVAAHKPDMQPATPPSATDCRADMQRVASDPSLNHHDPSSKRRRAPKEKIAPITFQHKEWIPEALWLKHFLEDEQDTFFTEVAKSKLAFDLGWWEELEKRILPLRTGGIDPTFIRDAFIGMKMWIIENPTKAPTHERILPFVTFWLIKAAEKERRNADKGQYVQAR